MPLYLDKKIVKRNPFATVDPGVAKLVQMGVEGATRPTRTSSAASAARLVATPSPSRSTMTSASTTCPARRTACLSLVLRQRRPRSTPTAVLPRSPSIPA